MRASVFAPGTPVRSVVVNEQAALLGRFGGNLNALHDAAHGARDLERQLRGIGKGIGEVTAGIFLRELRGIWPKARPLPSALALDAARDLGLIPPRLARGGNLP